MTTDQFSNYLSILEIRQRAFRRVMIFSGVLFIFAILSTVVIIIQTDWDLRSILLMAMFDLLFSMSLLTAWVRKEINKEKMELLNQIKRF